MLVQRSSAAVFRVTVVIIVGCSLAGEQVRVAGGGVAVAHDVLLGERVLAAADDARGGQLETGRVVHGEARHLPELQEVIQRPSVKPSFKKGRKKNISKKKERKETVRIRKEKSKKIYGMILLNWKL